jgi:hypothetical protein
LLGQGLNIIIEYIGEILFGDRACPGSDMKIYARYPSTMIGASKDRALQKL